MKHQRINIIKNGLEALFALTHAPGRSAYNPVEKRMGPFP